jgi:hypothetical protein
MLRGALVSVKTLAVTGVGVTSIHGPAADAERRTL